MRKVCVDNHLEEISHEAKRRKRSQKEFNMEEEFMNILERLDIEEELLQWL